MQALIFEIGSLLHETTGTRISSDFSIDPELDLFQDFKFKDGLEGQVVITRIDNGLAVSIENLNTKIIFNCQRCLKDYIKELKIDASERIFYERLSPEIDDPTEFFEIDSKSQKIDISEMLRQEIILHFPPVSVCSKSCKGLCSSCGTNLNEEKCECKPTQDLKPLSILKELYNGQTSSTKTKDL